MIKDTEQIRDRYATGATWLKSRYGDAYAEFNEWYAEEIRKAKEEAWDEGYDNRPGVVLEETEFGPVYSACAENPYRKD